MIEVSIDPHNPDKYKEKLITNKKTWGCSHNYHGLPQNLIVVKAPKDPIESPSKDFKLNKEKAVLRLKIEPLSQDFKLIKRVVVSLKCADKSTWLHK